MEIKTDISYGVVPIIKEGDTWRVLVVHQISYRGDDFWIFPKGHAEEGEIPLEAARRELAEETGIADVVISDESPITIQYSFIHEGVRIEKTVQYFIGYCHNQTIHISQPHEIKEIRWCSFSEAEELLTHQNSKDVLEQVRAALLMA